MKNCLILLTSSFPYDKGEPFLENEIFFHEDKFDKIIILAQELEPHAQLTRKIPANAEAFNIAQGSKKIVRAKDKIKGTIKALNPRADLMSDKDEIGSSFAKKAFFEYFEARSSREFKESIKVLNQYDFSEFDNVVIYSYWFFVICRTGGLIKQWLKEKGVDATFVSRAHGYDLYEYVNKLNYLPCRKVLAQSVDKVFTCSENGCNHLKYAMPMYIDKFVPSHLGTIDAGLGRFDKTFHLVTCSRTVSIKRLDRLVDALAACKDKIGEIYWTHIGDGALQKDLVKAANEKLGFMNVEFLGAMKNTEVTEYYKTHPVTLFVNVSKSEGLPVSIMEATSFGIPVLATDVGGTSEIVVDGVNGMLLSKDFTDEEFAKKLLSILNLSDEEYIEMRNNSRQIWEKGYNSENNFTLFTEYLLNEIKIKTGTV